MPHFGETSGALRELQKTVAAGGGGGGGGITDGDKGDITVAGGGTSWSIDAGVVNTNKLGGDITAAGKALLDDADATAQRTTLGLGTAATTAATDYATAAHSHAYGSLSDLPTLGGASSLNVGTTAGTVAAGDHNHTGVYAAASHTHSGLAPVGGSAGQVLKKISATDYDYSWQADSTSGGGGGASWSSGSITITTTTREGSGVITDAACTPASKVILQWADYSDTAQNYAGFGSVMFTAIPAAGSFTVEAFSTDASIVNGTFNFFYTLG